MDNGPLPGLCSCRFSESRHRRYTQPARTVVCAPSALFRRLNINGFIGKHGWASLAAIDTVRNPIWPPCRIVWSSPFRLCADARAFSPKKKKTTFLRYVDLWWIQEESGSRENLRPLHPTKHSSRPTSQSLFSTPFSTSIGCRKY